MFEEFHGLQGQQKNIRKKLTPGRYPVQKMALFLNKI